MGCTESKTKSSTRNEPTNDGSQSQPKPLDPEFFDDNGNPKMTPGAQEFLQLVTDEQNPVARRILDEWAVFVYRQSVLANHATTAPGSTTTTTNGSVAHQRTASGGSSVDWDYYRSPGMNRSANGHNNNNNTSVASDATSESAGAHQARLLTNLTRSTTFWANGEYEPIAHKEADRIGQLFQKYIVMELKHRRWRGNVQYRVEGQPAQGTLFVVAVVKVDGEPFRFDIAANYHAEI